MVEYTAPVFWLFFFLADLSLIVLRLREPGAERPFRVPLYPLTPLLILRGLPLHALVEPFVHGRGALAGIVVVLLAGVPVLLLARQRQRPVAPIKYAGEQA